MGTHPKLPEQRSTYGFDECGLDEIVSMTAVTNVRSQRVMERIGMTRNPLDDFLHPNLPEDSPLRPHVLFRITPSQRAAT